MGSGDDLDRACVRSGAHRGLQESGSSSKCPSTGACGRERNSSDRGQRAARSAKHPSHAEWSFAEVKFGTAPVGAPQCGARPPRSSLSITRRRWVPEGALGRQGAAWPRRTRRVASLWRGSGEGRSGRRRNRAHDARARQAYGSRCRASAPRRRDPAAPSQHHANFGDTTLVPFQLFAASAPPPNGSCGHDHPVLRLVPKSWNGTSRVLKEPLRVPTWINWTP